MYSSAGFTLLEVLLVLALGAVIVFLGLPVYQQLQIRTELDTAAVSYANLLHRAQLQSQAGDGDSAWGVYVQAGSITVFRGATYLTRQPLYDDTTATLSSIAVSGMTEVDFAKISGVPAATGTTTFTSALNETRQVSVNAKGIVSY